MHRLRFSVFAIATNNNGVALYFQAGAARQIEVNPPLRAEQAQGDVSQALARFGPVGGLP